MGKETLKVTNSQLFSCPEGKEGTVIVIEYDAKKTRYYCTGQREIPDNSPIEECNNCRKYPWQAPKF